MAFRYKKSWVFCVVALFADATSLYGVHKPSRAIAASCRKTKKQQALHNTQKLFDCSHAIQDYKNVVALQDNGPMLEHVQRDMCVYVALTECQPEATVSWYFVAADGFRIGALTQPLQKTTHMRELHLLIKNGVAYLNGKQMSDDFFIAPLSGHITFDSVAYDGFFLIKKHKNKFLCINSVGLEDYLYSVLHTESWPGWPLEVNKVFAIASRSYVVSKALEAQKNKRPYYVKNTNAHQTYRGRHERRDSKVLKEAVEQTRGIVLGFEGVPVLAMFDCCCGGIIPAHIDDFDFSKAPYLKRDYACTYCKKCSLYSWSVSYDQHVFEDIMRGHVGTLGRLSDVFVSKKDKAGLVGEIKLRAAGMHTVLSGKKMYSLLKEVRSFHFTIAKKGKKIIFNGLGFGHHMGLCQWGAHNMGQQGMRYTEILQFYFPCTNFMRLT